MRTKYFNDGLVGNNKIKASFTKTGELLRLFYGAADYKQFLDFYHTGVKVNDSSIIYLHNDINNIYSQEYIKDTNVLETKILNKYFKLEITQTDFVPTREKFLVKKYVFKNCNEIDLNVNFLVHSKILTNLNNDTSGFYKNDALIQYNHDFSVCTFSNQKVLSKQINGVTGNIQSGIIGGKDYIGMSSDSSVSYDLKKIKPGEEVSITLFIYINKNKYIDVINKLDEEISRIRKLDVEELKQDTVKYWKDFVKEHDILEMNKKEIPSKIKKIYNRSILLFPLLINDTAGGISAGIEVDEDKTKCGRYSYCWTRDAIYISEALDFVGMENASEKFYSEFCKMTQTSNGMWEQRYFTDGRLAPSWGYQIDETASVIFGVYSHYKFTNNIEFLKSNISMCEKAVKFLKIYIDDILNEKGKLPLSYDLWEEFEGISLYSMSAIYGGLKSMIKIYNEEKRVMNITNDRVSYIDNEIHKLDDLSEKIKEYCDKTFYDEYKKSYVRNTKDRKMDISTIGAIIPFNMFDINSDKVRNTIERINMTLRTYTGGYIRYEEDGYMGGYNPWPIATLWMAWYYIEKGEPEKAVEQFLFVTNSVSNHGLIGEQVNNDAMKPAWVIGLTWSHAMYLIILKKLIEKNLL